MEGAGVEDGGRVAVDFTHYPRPGRQEDGKYVGGDPCICYASFPSRNIDGPDNPPIIMCKQYDGFWAGHMVGTKYKRWEGGKFKMDCSFPAIAILGVIYASWGRDGKLKWEADPNAYPTELPQRCTIEGENTVPKEAMSIHTVARSGPRSWKAVRT